MLHLALLMPPFRWLCVGRLFGRLGLYVLDTRLYAVHLFERIQFGCVRVHESLEKHIAARGTLALFLHVIDLALQVEDCVAQDSGVGNDRFVFCHLVFSFLPGYDAAGLGGILRHSAMLYTGPFSKSLSINSLYAFFEIDNILW